MAKTMKLCEVHALSISPNLSVADKLVHEEVRVNFLPKSILQIVVVSW